MAEHRFIVPALDGPPSGGTLYNRELLRALERQRRAVDTLEPPAARAALQAGAPGVYWVDSLFVADFPALVGANLRRRPLGLIAHYLPSLVERGDDVGPDQLRSEERFALAHADVVLAPSRYMQRALVRLGLAERARCLVVEPGCLATGVAAEPTAVDGVRGLLIANVTPGKGVEPFLRALALELCEADCFRLDVIGGLDVDASYARRCQQVVERHPQLAHRVTFCGRLSAPQVIERLSGSNLLISASRMESFGMALAEARTSGVPIVALARGNVPSLVSRDSGGMLADDDRALARACVDLTRDRAAHRRAVGLARAEARPPRSFTDAARDFEAQLSATGLGLRA
jgi:glycosyltransferase involved in cell wall biosynthesis